MSGAYYNEYDKPTSEWLRQLIRAGHIAPGEVDDRSIVDVRPEDLRGFDQCHFFAGIGVWSHALRQSGWPDDRPVWTASLPCQPFSAAGKQEGHADDRHLAPVWLRLVRECRPAICIGEQVEPAIGFGWLDALFIRLEQSHYACGAAVFPACSVGAPHIRSRLYWVADAEQHGSPSEREPGRAQDEEGRLRQSEGPSATNGFWRDAIWIPCRDGKARPTGRGIHPLVVGNTKQRGSEELRRDRNEQPQDIAGGCDGGRQGPIEPSPKPLAHGPAGSVVRGGDCGEAINADAASEARVMRLGGYGNALVAPAAQTFIETVMECIA